MCWFLCRGLPLLLERVGVRRIKLTNLFPLIPAFSLKGEGADTHSIIMDSILET